MNCDPNSLIEAARCYSCLTNPEQRAAQIYLLCQWANNLGPGILFSWTPSGTPINWTDSNGPHNGDLATFQATAVNNTVTAVECNTLGITSLNNLSSLPALQNLQCGGNLLLASLDASNCSSLTFLSSTGSGIIVLNVTNCTSLVTMDCSLNVPLTTITGLATCAALQTLNCATCPNLTTLPGIDSCAALVTLDCNTCDITGTLDVSGLANLTNLICSYNVNMTALDATGCTSMAVLNCFYNSLTTLTVTGCTSLITLNCYSNFLTTLDVSTFTALFSLDCSRNSLTTLTVTGCTALTNLSCLRNSLAALDVSTCTSLSQLYCFYNSLTAITVTGCTALTTLDCSYNSLAALDVSTCIVLNQLNCAYNLLTTGAGGSVNIVLTNIVTNNPPAGNIFINNQTPLAPPDAGPPNGAAAKATLIGLAWIVVTD